MTMNLTDSLLAELDQESAGTRKTLERIPEDRLDWRPHERSWTVRELATHVATVPSWMTVTLEQDSFDIAGDDPSDREAPDTVDGIVALFDDNLSAARAALAEADDELLGRPWTLSNGGDEIFTMPRAAVLRTMIFNHTVHHRGQLTVYLRLTGAKVPGLYGPSADETL